MNLRKVNSKKQERKVAKELAGKVTPASGALWGAKADVRNDIFLVECKTTQNSYYSITFAVWNKINSEAIKDSLRLPVMCIDLNNGKYRYAVMNSKDVPDEVMYDIEIHKSGKSSFRISSPTVNTISRGAKSYELCVFDWEIFLNEVVPIYK